ncbi:MazG nucleotide pyrophosphohydrolase domain-containing protein [Companilactobacillus nuruki]|uniref:NTP pyrophosphohydrolase MazG-like domain-containing protein n=1 Tax=Companilactobacillus nuruki TaxID=1993540 RepID=A0A2N7ATF7_9LACO|nr:MazG nucleotide pyrophosphohydrolase domain-containing protein [Companilactobacillus nuruki]PMD69466.1 hypothetical protein CBP76_08070 [Companilactobacillus nuruki]
MKLQEHQQWLVDFYKKRNWYQYSPFVHLNFLTEEVGELSRAVRAIEIGRDHPGETQKNQAELDYNLKEELADVMDQLLVISSVYGIKPEELLQQSEDKLKKRFKKE